MANTDYDQLQAALGHRFTNVALLQTALTHRSYVVEHNERFEFLGDSVLNCAASVLLFDAFPDMDEGKLSRVRSHLVRQDCLASLGRQIGIPANLRLGAGELRGGGEPKDSIVADAMEAVFGAILLDAGFEAASACVIRLLRPVLDATPIESLGKDAKTRLQELMQAKRLKLPAYKVVVEGGTSASPMFSVQCEIEALQVITLGTGHSRRHAEQGAAQEALNAILEREYADPNLNGGRRHS